jgi:hypothetical protein
VNALAADLLASYFGAGDAPATLEVALARRDRELEVAGYRRHRVAKGSWRLEGTVARVQVRFGPVAQVAAFDTAWVLRDGAVLMALALGGEVALVAGASFTHEIEVGIG